MGQIKRKIGVEMEVLRLRKVTLQGLQEKLVVVIVEMEVLRLRKVTHFTFKKSPIADACKNIDNLTLEVIG